jgi:hypothetical protein
MMVTPVMAPLVAMTVPLAPEPGPPNARVWPVT